MTVEKDLSESEGGTEGNDDKETGASRRHSLLSVGMWLRTKSSLGAARC